jgi:hypothetical protein
MTFFALEFFPIRPSCNSRAQVFQSIYSLEVESFLRERSHETDGVSFTLHHFTGKISFCKT